MSTDPAFAFGKTLRPLLERNLYIARNVFVIGNSIGNSLIRFAYGRCVYAAREIGRSTSAMLLYHGLLAQRKLDELVNSAVFALIANSTITDGVVPLSGHADLHLDRQMGLLSVGQEVAKCKILHESS